MSSFLKYGIEWGDDHDDFTVERFMIRSGGYIQNGTQRYGKGLFEHYKNLMITLWPEDDWHRWAEEQLRLFLSHKVVGVMGPASSGKTYMAAKFGLADYWCFEQETCILISSTDLRGLELRVWGRIKDLYNRALDRFPYLPGNILESIHAIATDDIAEGGRARVLNRGIICIPCLAGGRYVGLGKYVGIKQRRVRLFSDECFPAGTLVDTQSGKIPIEQISCGDYILNCAGLSRVLATSRRVCSQLCRIHFSNHIKPIDCTPNHPFLTQRGWINCIDLHPNDYILSTYEAMYHLWNGTETTHRANEVLLRTMPTEIQREGVQAMRSAILPDGCESSFLHSLLWGEVEDDATGNCQAHDRWKRFGPSWEEYQRGDYGQPRGTQAPERLNKANQPTAQSSRSSRGAISNETGIGVVGVIPGSSHKLSGSNWQERQTWRSQRLLARPSFFGSKIRRGDRWALSQKCDPAGKGSTKGFIFERARVDRIEILKPEGDSRYNKRAGGYKVYNLQIDGHHSYSVNGIAVRNCQFMGSSFLDAVSNLMSNPDFKGIFMGNPSDPLDPLGRACEPEEGWGAHPEPTKTTTWKTRFLNGVCLNLVGTDSPNFDYPEDQPAKFPYLVSREHIKNVESFWTKDSQQYYSQAVGVMKTGLELRRVITRLICGQHHAFDKAVWSGAATKKIYAVDAAYGGVGGDRCVGGWIEFGPDVNNHQIIRIEPPKIIPVSIKRESPPEHQIAEYVLTDLQNEKIEPRDCFYDSTGRGTLGTAFATVFGISVPTPVEFGGRPSKRPVRHDLFTWDADKFGRRDRRHVRCDEYYVDFVTELWFCVRYIIECEQLRELPENVLMEGCSREYGRAAGNKIFVESKHDPKARERMARSPDLFDWLVTAVEGARQRGFQIHALGKVMIDSRPDSYDWLSKRVRDNEKWLASKQLKHA